MSDKVDSNGLILTGWGWKEYAVPAAVALRALDGRADVMGMSKRRLPEFLEEHGGDRRAIYIVGVALGGDAERLAKVLSSLRGGGTKVVWISSIPMDESLKKILSPFIEIFETKAKQDLFNGALVKAISKRMFPTFCLSPRKVSRFRSPSRAITNSSPPPCTPTAITATRRRTPRRSDISRAVSPRKPGATNAGRPSIITTALAAGSWWETVKQSKTFASA